MRRSILLILGLLLAVAPPLRAGTFARKPIAPDLGVDAFTRAVARELVGRDVFANPYATVTISNVDLYDRFPYVEERHFEVVSDPRWNRLVFGELGQGLSAYDGAGTALGALSGPRGMAVDERGRIYVADAGNDRVLVLQASTEFDHMELTPLYAISDLSGPYGVAYSDGGTPFRDGDDWLYVTDTGRNRVAAYALEGATARRVAVIGDLGAGTGRFAGPMAIAVGHAGGSSTADVYVADAHNRRIVHLLRVGSTLQWRGDARIDADLVTSLDTDQWGNLYAAAPRQGVVRKLNASLEPVAELRSDLANPRGFHLPFTNVSDHRDGSVRRIGQPNALSLDQWSDQHGVSLWGLGVGIQELRVEGGAAPMARFTLTDPGSLTLDIVDPASGRRLSSRAAGTMAAGAHEIALEPEDLAGLSGSQDVMLRLSAVSSYGNGASDVAEASFRADGAGRALPSRVTLLGNQPNPARAGTEFAFLLPQRWDGDVALRLFDATGRRLRSFRGAFAPGLNHFWWDGTDEGGRPVRPGLYFYQLEVGQDRFTRRMSVVR